jgi:hypothetical protein
MIAIHSFIVCFTSKWNGGDVYYIEKVKIKGAIHDKKKLPWLGDR